MSKKLKIILSVLGLLIAGTSAFIVVGLWTMEIEDTYGDNQDIFYNARQGDYVGTTMRRNSGKLKKRGPRFYVTNALDTLDIRDWWDCKNIEIYRLVDIGYSNKALLYADVNDLKEEGHLVLKSKLR